MSELAIDPGGLIIPSAGTTAPVGPPSHARAGGRFEEHLDEAAGWEAATSRRTHASANDTHASANDTHASANDTHASANDTDASANDTASEENRDASAAAAQDSDSPSDDASVRDEATKVEHDGAGEAVDERDSGRSIEDAAVVAAAQSGTPSPLKIPPKFCGTDSKASRPIAQAGKLQFKCGMEQHVGAADEQARQPTAEPDAAAAVEGQPVIQNRRQGDALAGALADELKSEAGNTSALPSDPPAGSATSIASAVGLQIAKPVASDLPTEKTAAAVEELEATPATPVAQRSQSASGTNRGRGTKAVETQSPDQALAPSGDVVAAPPRAQAAPAAVNPLALAEDSDTTHAGDARAEGAAPTTHDRSQPPQPIAAGLLAARDDKPSEPGGRAEGLSGLERVRFVERVAKAFHSLGDEGGEVRLRLSPPELGSLRLELSLREGLLAAHLETETAAARNVLLDNLPALRDRLAEQNIKVERFDVDVRNQERQASGEHFAGHAGLAEQHHRHRARPHAAVTAAGSGERNTGRGIRKGDGESEINVVI